MKVLFLGNSHTFVHYVPARAAHFCQSHGTDLETTMLTHPGMGLDWHLNQSQTYYNLRCGKYDAVKIGSSRRSRRSSISAWVTVILEISSA